ncbi:MAG: helix-turn-helix domain-containing protein [Nitrospirales bacterium]
MHQPSSSSLWTIATLSTYLQIKASTLYAWVAQGKIPALRIHGLIRFDPKDIQGWLQQWREPSSQIKDRMSHGPSLALDLDQLIARVKTDVYTARQGKPDRQLSPPAKGGNHGAL